MAWKTLDDMELGGKIVLTRVDINVPMEDGRVTDATRIERIVPTVKDILAKGGKPVLLAHFGRPKGKPVPEMSLRHVVPALETALGQPVTFIETPDRARSRPCPSGSVVLIENTRFTPMETANDPKMAQFLASLGDVYCNDAFSAAHRAHASTEGVAHLLPSCAGRLMQAELTALEKALGDPERPVVAVVGGAKVSTKLDLLGQPDREGRHAGDRRRHGQHLPCRAGHRRGGKSLCEHDLGDTAREILAKAETTGCEVILPTDVVVAKEFAAGGEQHRGRPRSSRRHHDPRRRARKHTWRVSSMPSTGRRR
jgi:phosphoglycerate kinase